jgi:hypothetical protein
MQASFRVPAGVVIICLAALIPAGHATAQALPAPARITAAETAPGVITLTWSAVAGADEYFIGRSVWPDGFRRAGVVTDTVYVDSTASAGKRHTYTVNAVGSSQRARSNQVIASGNGVIIPDAARRPQIAARSSPEPSTGASPGFVPPDSLITPAADTISAARCRAETNRQQQQRQQRLTPARRTGRGSIEVAGDEEPTELTSVQQAYVEGKCRYPTSPGYPTLWYPVAEESGLPYDEQVRSWRELNVIALVYRHLLQREPTREEIQRHVPALQRGTHWRDLWRTLAQSDERDERFGYWAAAPIASRGVARSAFGLSFEPLPQMCYGGLGPGCGGTVPDGRVEPRWFGRFSMPDGTEFAYVSIGVAVGSILHDNACLVHREGLNCDGLGAGDLVKSGDWPAALEWNKATWNVIDGRVWREVFGPYPVSRALQQQFYDDLRPVHARTAYMAPVASMATIPVLTVLYSGGETRRTQALKAPAGTSLDDRDAAYCASGAFARRESFPGKAGWGICR